MLGPRLQLAFDLYLSCDLAADIGTDHARLPSALLKSGKCRRMILTDISPSALASARREMESAGLTERAELRLGDGLSVLGEDCAMISILGMGGRTIREILIRGLPFLKGAELLLSAHSNLPQVRQAVSDIGYRLVSETPCLEDGRFYLMLHAVPGEEKLSGRQIRLGVRLFESDAPLLLPYLRHRRKVLEDHLKGLETAKLPDPEDMRLVQEDIAFYLKEEQKHDHC